jgi:hypothetical protein
MDLFHPGALVFFGATAGSILVIAHTSDLMREVTISSFVSVLLAFMSVAQSATPVVLVDDFLKAWNSHDAKLSTACSRKTRFGCPSPRVVS